MATASLKLFHPDLPPTGRYIRQRVLAGGDPHDSRVIEVRLGARPDRRDFEPSRCLATRRRVGGQCGRFRVSGRSVCHLHGCGSPRRQHERGTLSPELSGAIGAAIRNVRRGRLQLNDVFAFFPALKGKVELYRQDPERIDLRDDAIDLTVLKAMLMSGDIPADTGYVMATVPKLVVAKARVLTARDAIERRSSMPIETVHQLVKDLLDVIRRNVPEERHEFIARELVSIGGRFDSTTGAQ